MDESNVDPFDLADIEYDFLRFRVSTGTFETHELNSRA